MRLLVFADLHLDTQFQWLGTSESAARSRRQALYQVLDNICRIALENRVDAVLCAGDLYEHDRFSPDTMRTIQAAFEQLAPIPVYVSPGNHDWYGPKSIYSQANWSENVHVFTSDRLVPVTLTDGLTLWGAAHRAPANTDGFLDDFEVDRGGVNLALFHGSEQTSLPFQGGDKLPHSPFQARQIEAAGLDHAFVGHYHRPRHEARYTYPGNPEPLTFGEDGDRGCVLVTVHQEGSIARDV